MTQGDCSINCRDCPVWEKSLFRELDAAMLAWLAERKQAVGLNKKQVLFTQGQPVDGIYCHMHGLAKVVQTDTDGNVRFSRLVLPGDTSGHRSLFIETAYKGTTDVLSDDLQACFIPRDDILYMLSHSAAFARSLVEKIATELKRAEEDQISIKEKTVRGRLAQLLCDLSREYSQPGEQDTRLIKCEIQKKDIASLLSVANETVIRLMSEMKSEGLIGYQDKRIVICDLQGLAKIR